jgi:hypothetical protein
MEKRINTKIEQYVGTLKTDVRNKIVELGFDQSEKINELIEYVYEYQRLSILKDDLTKRKRVKNSIPSLNRCNARRANNEQCTRRRKEGSEYCGTHMKGTPNGYLNLNECSDCNNRKIDVIAEEINGIVYYIDSFMNVYKPEDIMSGKENPQIIAKCSRENGVPSLNFV